MGEFYSVHSSLTSVRGRTSAPTLVMRSPPQSPAPGCETLTHSLSLKAKSRNFMDTHVLAKLSPCSRTNKSKTSNLDPLLFKNILEQLRRSFTNVLSHCSQDSIQALLWRCIFLHWFQYRSGWTSLCHATSADNKREKKGEQREKGEGRLVAALATALLSATARF